MIRTAILGASGFVGGELLRLLTGHPDICPTKVFADSRAGQTIADAHPHLTGQEGTFVPYESSALGDVDLVFAALPHGKSQRLAADVLDRGIPFVDLGADFRLRNPHDYARWYGEEHQAPGLLPNFVYGLPEINRAAIRGARAVAAPGCYPTAAILALKPLADAGLIERDGIIVNAASGVSGSGRTASEGTAFNTLEGSFAAYGLLNHRHTAEMEQAIDGGVLFTPHLAPMTRGILATCYAKAKGPMDDDRPMEVLRKAFAGEPFVHVGRQPPATKWVAGSNMVQLTARYDARTGHVVAIAAIDNLVKGAAGQMIQCANLMLNIEETRGLPVFGMFP